jgi:hypothetical protein
MRQTTRHHVDFIATKTVKEPTEMAFTTKTGKFVDFVARKPLKEQVDVSFIVRDRKK